MLLAHNEWLDLAAIISAMCDVINSECDTFGDFYQRRIAAQDAGPRSSVLRRAMSGYSDDDVKRFRDLLSKGDVQQGKRLLYSVLRKIHEINGQINRFSDWTQAYQKLGC